MDDFNITELLEKKARQNALWITPAYGRMYTDERAMLDDWNAEKDFKIWAGPYCSIRDLGKMRDMGFVIVLMQFPIGKYPALDYMLPDAPDVDSGRP